MNPNISLTDKESKAIKALKVIAKTWPKSLWLFSASGRLWVMKKGVDGQMITYRGGVDPNYCVGKIDIENDG